jgi:flagellar motor switch protein FliG
MSLQKSRRALSGVEKAAILLIAVGTEAAAFILQNLPEEDIESVTQELVRLRNVEPEYIQEVVEEFYHSEGAPTDHRFCSDATEPGPSLEYSGGFAT